MQDQKVYRVERFEWAAKYGREGANSKNFVFTVKKTGESRSIMDHYFKQYNIRLKNFR
jgi:hypothetical protein